ncbi:putative ribonuclease H-like domain-containing protein [Tanacetum coccineum]
MNEFCAKKGIKREYSIARTPQQNGVAERKNRTLIEAARTMLADSLLPIQFWAEAVNTACYVLNRVLVTKPQMKTPYEILMGRSPNISFMRPFGCSLTILNTLDQLGKFDGKSEEGYLLGYSTSSKAQELLLQWNGTADKEVHWSLNSKQQALHDELVSLMHQESLAKLHNDAQRNAFEEEKKRIALAKDKECAKLYFQLSTAKTPPQSTGNTPTDSDDDVPKDGVFSTNSFDAEHTDTEEDGAPDYNNMNHTIDVSSTPTHRIHKIHPQSQIIGKSTAGVQTRRKLKESTSNQHQALLSFIYKQNRTNHKDQQTCLFACFLSQEEPKKVSQALADESWVEAMQEELLQFKLQDVWVLCDLPDGKRVIGTKWVFRNKRDERDSFWHLHLLWAFLSIKWMSKVHFYMATSLKRPQRAWYERLSTFLLKHGYRRGAIDKTLFIKKDRRDIMLVQVYVDDIIFGSTKSSMVKDFEELMQKEFKMSSMGELTFFLGLQVKQTSADHGHNVCLFICDAKRFQVTPKKLFQTVTMLGTIMIDDQLQEDVNILEEDWSLGNARNKQLWLSHLQKHAICSHPASCCAQVLWMQNQLLDYGFNFMNTEIHIDNESTICIVRNPVLHSKTKHIQIRHHFIRDCYEQRLINVVKVHTDDNVADLLTKGFDLQVDLARFNFLVVTIGMMNP